MIAIGPEYSKPSYQMQISFDFYESVQWKTDFSKGKILKLPFNSQSVWIMYSGFTNLFTNMNWGLKVIIFDFVYGCDRYCKVELILNSAFEIFGLSVI